MIISTPSEHMCVFGILWCKVNCHPRTISSFTLSFILLLLRTHSLLALMAVLLSLSLHSPSLLLKVATLRPLLPLTTTTLLPLPLTPSFHVPHWWVGHTSIQMSSSGVISHYIPMLFTFSSRWCCVPNAARRRDRKIDIEGCRSSRDRTV